MALLPIVTFAIQAQTRTAAARFVEGPPVLDGQLDDAAWQDGALLGSFRQKDPDEGAPASEDTWVDIIYTSEALYLGVNCLDSQPERIVATERRRDEDLTKDDSIGILLDTFLDRRNAFLFRTNALGTRYDALITDEGRDINAEWDEKWEVSSATSDRGWTAEIMIPFKSLRMGDAEGMVWGLELERLIRRKNEAVYWNTFSRNFQFADVSQAGRLSGLDRADPGLRLRVKPYLLAGFEQVPENGRLDTRNLSDVGLEVLKYRPTSALTVELTLNTDFAQTEVDDLVTNITRFPLFFPEKREFFLENAGVFEFGTGVGVGGSRDFIMFFSRRIGLSPSREPIPVLGGVKLTGRVGKYTVGIIDAQEDEALGFPSENSAVFRLKRDVLERSNIGVMFTNRQSSLEGDRNRVFGADANFVLARNLNIYTFVARSETPDLDDDDWSAFGRLRWDSDYLLAAAEYLLVQRNFNPELGFVPRRDQKKSSLQFGIRPRPQSDLFRQFVWRTRLDYTENQAGQQETLRYHYFTFEAHFQSGDRLMVDAHRNSERLFEPFEIEDGIVIPVGTYRGWDVLGVWDGAPHRRISGRPLARYRREWGFFGGDRTEVRIEPQVKINDSLSFDVAYALDDVSLPWGEFTSSVINTRMNYSFSRRWLTSTTVQYSSLRDVFNFRFRLNFIYRTGDDLFIIYNEGRNLDLEARGEALLGRSIMVKLTHSFDF